MIKKEKLQLIKELKISSADKHLFYIAAALLHKYYLKAQSACDH